MQASVGSKDVIITFEECRVEKPTAARKKVFLHFED